MTTQAEYNQFFMEWSKVVNNLLKEHADQIAVMNKEILKLKSEVSFLRNYVFKLDRAVDAQENKKYMR